MREAVLLESTGSRTADKIIKGVIGIFGQVFPCRVRGYYLRGSYASDTRAAGSDLDMFVVFEDDFVEPAEVEKAHEICGHCALLSPILLEIIVVSEHQLRQPGTVALALNLKLATRLVHGQDIRADLPDMRVDAYVRSVIHTPYFSYRRPTQRRDHQAMTYPLRHIDPAGPFYGYDQWLLPGPDGGDIPSTKLLVGSVGWTATAIIALQTGRYVRDKSACVELYREHIADRWTDLVVRVHELCRNRWHYRIPSADADRLGLRALCEQALPFQNHFLGLYRGYLLTELRSAEPDRQILAARRLGQIRFPDDEVVTALRRLRTAGPPEVRHVAAATLDAYPGPAEPAA